MTWTTRVEKGALLDFWEQCFFSFLEKGFDAPSAAGQADRCLEEWKKRWRE